MVCQLEENFIDDVRYLDWKDADMDGSTDAIEDDNPYIERFVVYFNLLELQPYHRVLIVTYFGFTSLSTVGLGDYHPRSDMERILTAFMLLFGVALFSIIMGSFCEILVEFQHYNDEIDKGDQLVTFFLLLQKFNNREEIDIDLKRSIEAHFQYKWNHDKSYAFEDEDDLRIYEELPLEV